MPEKLRPLQDRVLVKPIPLSDRSEGGIIIPESAQQAPIVGTITAVGPGKGEGYPPMNLEVGQKVMYGRGAGFEITTELDGDILLLRAGDILGVIEQHSDEEE
jgi:chaperonin GroES